MFDKLADKSFAIIRRAEDVGVLLLEGNVREVLTINEIETHKPGTAEVTAGDAGYTFDHLALLPFAQVKERGFVARDDGAPIVVLDIHRVQELDVEMLNAAFPPREQITFLKEITFDSTSKEYEDILRRVIADEIGNGEGANFVIPRVGTATIEDMNLAKALTIFNNLLRGEKGTYWTFLVKFEDSYLIGATPERHVTYENGIVRMNPISGTYRKNEAPTTAAGARKHLLAFLNDAKEINELFMVVDEELKQMARICSAGGMIIGPFIKDMARLAHTEYLLSGRSTASAAEILRESMFAATVTGSPIESACRVIKKYESGARRYYGSAVALLGTSSEGNPYLDSPIPIRTIEINEKGEMLFRVGGTLVRDSDPHHERLETDVKFAAMRSSLAGAEPQTYPWIEASLRSDEVKQSLFSRNQLLAQFWFFDQGGVDHLVPSLEGKSVIIVENEDDFAYMLGHMMRALGLSVKTVKFNEFSYERDRADLLVVGPGPGNPSDQTVKMEILSALTQKLLHDEQPFLSVCLGHQILCKALGIPLTRKKNPQQGVAKNIDFFGDSVRVGFYNTFCGNSATFAREQLEIAAGPDGEVHAIRGEHYYGVQFHPESILSRDGLNVLKSMLTELLT